MEAGLNVETGLELVAVTPTADLGEAARRARVVRAQRSARRRQIQRTRLVELRRAERAVCAVLDGGPARDGTEPR